MVGNGCLAEVALVQGGPRGQATQIAILISVFLFLMLLGPETGPGKAQEVFKKFPGGRGFVLTEYELLASHADPMHDHFY